MDLYRKIFNNIDEKAFERIAENKSYGKVGECANAIIDAMIRCDVRMFGSTPYYFNDEIYVPMDDFRGTILRVIRKVDTDGKLMAKSLTITNICFGCIMNNKLEVNPNMICFRNCVLDIRSEEVLSFSPDIHVVSQLEYEYDKKAKPGLWIKFLKDVLDDDGIRLLQEFLGLIFVDRRKIKIETMLFLLGKGANGKSVVFDTVMGVLGSNNVSNYEITALTNSSDRGKNLMDINGKLLNYCSEISAKSFSSSNFKSLISGEPQQARPIYGEPTKVENIPLMMANANTMPNYQDTSNGVFRRIAILPFNKTIAENNQDKQLSAKMRNEYPAILNWILDGRRSVAARGFVLDYGESIRKAMSDYRQDNNTVYQFVDANGYDTAGNAFEWVLAKDLYDRYTEYCEMSKIECETPTKFGLSLKNIGFEKDRKSNGVVYKIYKYD